VDVIMNDIKIEFVEKGLATIQEPRQSRRQGQDVGSEDKEADPGRIKSTADRGYGRSGFRGGGRHRKRDLQIPDLQGPGRRSAPV
jgi:3-hydroxyacyl-CoA dehydrogenase